jgi:hypothetical protein
MNPGEYVMIAVSDNGSGISSEHLDKIFEPFFTTKDSGKGSGLGLSMVYGFVKQSKGYIFADAEDDVGTTFRIYLPSVLQGPETSEKTSPAEGFGNQEVILVVEDEESVRDMAAMVWISCPASRKSTCC